MGIVWQKVIALWIGWLADRLFGDPVELPHPVVLFGKSISFLERNLNRCGFRVFKGMIVSCGLILSVYFVASWIFNLLRFNDIVYVLASSIMIFYCLAGRTLIVEVKKTFEASLGDLEAARRQLSRIVGRDTNSLNRNEIRTAAMETLAENLSDGVIAPLFWFLLLGVPGMVTYKMVNTLDSMIGYRNERFRQFGMVAARIDDFANFIPARLTALLMLLVSGNLRNSGVVFKDGKNHLSPNSGYPEAALAAILNCRFGGPHDYFGQSVYKPFIGQNERELEWRDCDKAVKVNNNSEAVMIIIVTLIMLLF